MKDNTEVQTIWDDWHKLGVPIFGGVSDIPPPEHFTKMTLPAQGMGWNTWPVSDYGLISPSLEIKNPRWSAGIN